MKVKTSELIGSALDWAVAVCEFDNPSIHGGVVHAAQEYMPFQPSTDWSQGGPIINQEIGNLWKHNKLDPNEPDVWTAVAYYKAPDGTMLYYEDGPTPLIAAMRCYVASKLGDEVDIPEKLI